MRKATAAWPSTVERWVVRRSQRWKRLNITTAGSATKRPTAVATRASEIPAITLPAPPAPVFRARSAKARMTPSTVPKSPMKGALLPSVPRKARRAS